MITTAAIVITIVILAALFLRVKGGPPVQNEDLTGTCKWARTLYHNGLISMPELNKFMAHHGKCATCLPEENGNITSGLR